METVARQETPTLSMPNGSSHPLPWVHFARVAQGRSSYIDSLTLEEEWMKEMGFDEQELREQRSAA